MKGFIIIIASLALTACATSSKQVQATYVSPLVYKDYDCDQLSLEADRISRRVSELTGQIDKRAAGDKTQMAIALVLFWPAAFLLGNNEAQNTELSKLKGESEALEKAAIQQKCNFGPSINTKSTEGANSQSAEASANETAAAITPSLENNNLSSGRSSDTYLQLADFAKQRDEGLITEEEFKLKEAELLKPKDETEE